MERRAPAAIGRLLVVDDDEMNRDMLSRRLARQGFEVTVAEHGEEALELMEAEAFDLVLLDIMMPGVDGLQVLERVRRERGPEVLPIIMATAKHESDDVVYALKLGANDYVTKPLDFPVVLARVRTQLSLKRATEQLAAAHARMKNDLAAAARIQQSLIPQEAPAVDGVEIAWRYRPCDELAGDILDAFVLPDGRVGLYLLDVSGHGVPSALLSVTLSRVLSHLEEESMLFDTSSGKPEPLAPGAVAARLNTRFPMDPNTRQYFTLAYGILHPASRELHYVAAAQPGPIQIGADGAHRQHPPSGMAIGWFPHAKYQEHRVELAAGDRVYFVSDGLIEAPNERDEQFGIERLTESLAARRGAALSDSLDGLLEDLAGWTGDAGAGDDVTVLAWQID